MTQKCFEMLVPKADCPIMGPAGLNSVKHGVLVCVGVIVTSLGTHLDPLFKSRPA